MENFQTSSCHPHKNGKSLWRGSFILRRCQCLDVPVVFYRRETWSLALREEYRLKVSENRARGRIFGPKLDEILEFEVLTAVVMKSSIFWDIMPCSPLIVNRRFRATCLPLTFTLVSCSVYSWTMKMEAICSFEMSLTFQRTAWRYIPGDKLFFRNNRRLEITA
jgi:hypothetical protein